MPIRLLVYRLDMSLVQHVAHLQAYIDHLLIYQSQIHVS